MTRKLATIQVISSIEEHPNADKLEIANVLGWRIIIGKGEFKEGDKIVYFETDSVLPEIPEFEFLRERCFVNNGIVKGFRLKMIRLRGEFSQGLIMPLSILEGKKFPNDIRENPKYDWKEGQEVSTLLGVKLFEKPIPVCMQGDIKGPFPSFLHVTDETRIQLLGSLLKEYEGTKCYISEKVDGCLHYRMSIKTDKGEIEIGRIVNQKLPVNILTYNEEKGICEYKEIKEYHKYPIENKKWIRIGCGCRGKGNRKKYIDCTDNHKFFTNDGWKEAKYLKVGETIYHYNNSLDEELNQIILGCLLGDSSIYGSSKNYKTVAFNHSVKQKEYFEFKSRLFGNQFIKQKSQISGYGSEMVRGLLRTNLSILKLIESNCILNNKKTITKNWCDNISPLGLAFWYMDDGNISHRDEIKQKAKCIINTQGFSLEEVTLLQDMLKNKFSINTSIGDKSVYKGYILIFNKDNTSKFCSLIAPYIPQCMKYKLPKKYENWNCCLNNISFSTSEKIIDTKIISIEELKNNSYSNHCYDLTIKDNHNYFTHGILVHNSSTSCFYKDGEFGVCSRMYELKPDTRTFHETPPLVKVNDKIYLSNDNGEAVGEPIESLPSPKENVYWKMIRKYNIEEKLRKLGKNIAIQGESFGEGLQGNPLKIREQRLAVFNVFDIDKNEYYSLDEMINFCNELGLETVPILDKEYILESDIQKIVKMSIGNSVINSECRREGIVIRPVENKIDKRYFNECVNGRISFKAINPEYALNEE